MDTKTYVRTNEEDNYTEFLTLADAGNGIWEEKSRIMIEDCGEVYDTTFDFPTAFSQGWLDSMGFQPTTKTDDAFLLVALLALKHDVPTIDSIPPMQNPFHTWGIMPNFA